MRNVAPKIGLSAAKTLHTTLAIADNNPATDPRTRRVSIGIVLKAKIRRDPTLKVKGPPSQRGKDERRIGRKKKVSTFTQLRRFKNEIQEYHYSQQLKSGLVRILNFV